MWKSVRESVSDFWYLVTFRGLRNVVVKLVEGGAEPTEAEQEFGRASHFRNDFLS